MRRLLLDPSHAGDSQRFAVGPALAAAADRAGWSFDCYYGALRRGLHLGGGDPGRARPGWPSGSLVSGGRHLENHSNSHLGATWWRSGTRTVFFGRHSMMQAPNPLHAVPIRRFSTRPRSTVSAWTHLSACS